MVNIIPLGNQVLVRPLPKQEKTSGGLIIPSAVNKELEEGEVIAFAEAVINIQVGNKILYSSRAGTPLLFEDVNYKFLSGPTINETGDIKAII